MARPRDPTGEQQDKLLPRLPAPEKQPLPQIKKICMGVAAVLLVASCGTSRPSISTPAAPAPAATSTTFAPPPTTSAAQAKAAQDQFCRVVATLYNDMNAQNDAGVGTDTQSLLDEARSMGSPWLDDIKTIVSQAAGLNPGEIPPGEPQLGADCKNAGFGAELAKITPPGACPSGSVVATITQWGPDQPSTSPGVDQFPVGIRVTNNTTAQVDVSNWLISTSDNLVNPEDTGFQADGLAPGQSATDTVTALGDGTMPPEAGAKLQVSAFWTVDHTGGGDLYSTCPSPTGSGIGS